MTQNSDFDIDALFADGTSLDSDSGTQWDLPGGGRLKFTARSLNGDANGSGSKLLTTELDLPEGGLSAGALLAAVGFPHDQLPTPLAGALTLELGEIVGLIDGDGALLSLGVPVGFPGRHPILPGLLEIDDPALRFQFDRPDKESRYSVDIEIGAHVDIAGARMELRGGFLLPPGSTTDTIDRQKLQRGLEQLKDQSGDPASGSNLGLSDEDIEAFLTQYDAAQARLEKNGSGLPFFIEGRLEDALDLGALLGRFGWPALGKAKVVRLDFSYHSVSGSYDFDVEVADAIEACGGQLALEDIGLTIHGRTGESGGMSGEVSALLRLGDAHVALSAQGSTAGSAWLFRGAVMGVDADGLSALLESTFQITAPDAIKGFELDLLDAEIDLGSERLTLHASGRIPLFKDAEHKARATISVELAHDGDGWQKTFSGHLVVDVGTSGEPDELSFALDVSHDSKTTDLVATFRDPNGPPFDVGAAIRSLWPGAPELPKIDLRIPAAGVIHHAPAQKESETLFALDVDGGLDLSNITLPSLPVPSGTDLSAGLGKLRLNVHLFALLTGHVPSTELQDLASANDFPLPELSGSRDTTLIADVKIRFGNEVHSLPVPLAPPSAEGNGKLGPATSDKSKQAPSTQEPKWIDVDKRFGPLHVARLGLDMAGTTVTARMEAALSMAGLTLSLDGLAVSAELTDLSKARFSFSGLGIDYANPPLEIGGALFIRESKDDNGKPVTSYAGEAILRTEAFSVRIDGLFREHDDQPSLMLFGLFEKPLGGPAFFFVTGLAAGLGYNRAIRVPEVDKVADFPMVLAVTSDKAADKPEDPGQALEMMGRHAPATTGAHFLAIGVKFTSFKVVDSFALLIGREHERLEFDLLGLSKISQPYGATKPLTKARIAWLAHFSPEQGILTLRAEILPGAYVFDPACELSGGFAASFWFAEQPAQGIPAGDFALTLGGYHPAYKVPAHYPRVTPLKLEWQVNKHLRIKGQAYMALTSHAVMAGGRLEATWHDTDVRVYFVASADFLLCWEPYYYDIQVSISLRASVTVHFFTTWTIDFDASARLHLWGPEFAGEAEVHLKVVGVDVSFHVAFNTAAKRPQALDWEAFHKSFLPATTIRDNCIIGAIAFACGGGLLGQTEKGEGETGDGEWIVAASLLTINITSAVPATLLQGAAVEPAEGTAAKPGIAPMGIAPGAMKSDLSITIAGPNNELTIHIDGQKENSAEEASFLLTPTRGNLPAAAWGQSRTEVEHCKIFVSPPRLNDPSLVQDVLVGAQLKSAQHAHKPKPYPADKTAATTKIHPRTTLAWGEFKPTGRPRVAGTGG
jgi:hypothetical protein